MNCIGPTARSCTVSRSYRPPSVSRTRAVPTPVSGMPTIGGVDIPSVCSTAPANRPWLDSTRPMAAINVQSMPQCTLPAAWVYASIAVDGMPPAASGEAAAWETGTTVGGRPASGAGLGAGSGAGFVAASAGTTGSAATTDPAAATAMLLLRATACSSRSTCAGVSVGPASGTNSRDRPDDAVSVAGAALAAGSRATRAAVAPAVRPTPRRSGERRPHPLLTSPTPDLVLLDRHPAGPRRALVQASWLPV